MMIIQVAGRLGNDAETRFTASGQKVTTLRLATNTRKGGKEETTWWRATLWGERFDKMLPYLKKGSALIVVGEMGKPEIWTDREGRPQVSLELTADIVRFNPFGGTERSNETGSPSTQTHQSHKQEPMDFDHALQSGAGMYSHANQTEEPIPF